MNIYDVLRRLVEARAWITVSEEMDQCPDCTELTVTPQRPELLPNQVSPHLRNAR